MLAWYLILDPGGEFGGLAHQHVGLGGLAELVLPLLSQAEQVVILRVDLQKTTTK